jgi:hypothetical protein
MSETDGVVFVVDDAAWVWGSRSVAPLLRITSGGYVPYRMMVPI